MSHDAGEVSWQTLRRIVHRWSGDKAELEAVSALDGGSISTTLMLLTRAGDRAVLKVSPHRVDPSYIREAEQLKLLRSIGAPAPRVFECHVGSLDSPDSYLLIEHMNGVNLHDAKDEAPPEQFDRLQEQLADVVLTMHGQTAPEYARIGEPTDSNHGKNWPAFFRGLYDTIWHECEKHTIFPMKMRKAITRAHEKLDHLVIHDDKPRLTHGDLWTSNILAAPDESGDWNITGLLDPNCKFAHAEYELAYLELFHTVTPAFTKKYQCAHRLGDDYHKRRKHVYQLYELINHVNLFGARYLKPLGATLEKLAPFV